MKIQVEFEHCDLSTHKHVDFVRYLLAYAGGSATLTSGGRVIEVEPPKNGYWNNHGYKYSQREANQLVEKLEKQIKELKGE